METDEAKISHLFLPQYYDTQQQWNDRCAELLDLIPTSNKLNLSVWPTQERPVWTSKALPLPEHYEFLNPLFGFYAIYRWNPTGMRTLFKLFYRLMEWRCDSPEVLNALTSKNQTLFQFVVKDVATDLIQSLLGTTHLSLFGSYSHNVDCSSIEPDHLPYCCAFCTLVDAQRDLLAVTVWNKLSNDQRKQLYFWPHVGFVTAAYKGCTETTNKLWDYAEERELYLMDDFCGQLGSIGFADYDHTLLCEILVDASDSLWKKLTNPYSGMGRSLLSHFRTFKSRSNLGPLRWTLGSLTGRPSKTLVSSNTFDERASWLIDDLTSDQLNHIGPDGKTLMMHAAERQWTLTMKALLRRGIEVDLLANPVHVKQNAFFLHKRFSSLTSGYFDHQKNAIHYLPTPSAMSIDFKLVATELMLHTGIQQSLRTRCANQVADLLFRLKPECDWWYLCFSKDLVLICLTYAGLPEPEAWTGVVQKENIKDRDTQEPQLKKRRLNPTPD